jgi:hypothetical protein
MEKEKVGKTIEFWVFVTELFWCPDFIVSNLSNTNYAFDC